MARIFITGSADGLGLLAAKELIRLDHQVVLHARNAERKRETIVKVPQVASVVAGDLSNLGETKNLAYEVNALGKFDAVIHNAGITMWSRFDALKDLEIFERVMEVNYYAPVRLTALTLPHLKQSRGLIVAVASLAGLTGVPERSLRARRHRTKKCQFFFLDRGIASAPRHGS